jgi:hypothetical protein
VTKERLKALLAEYGPLALYTYLGLFVVVMAGFIVAIKAGFEGGSTQGTFAAVGAAWLATKATTPLRIAATLGLTPLISVALHKLRARRGIPPQSPPAPPTPPEPKAD